MSGDKSRPGFLSGLLEHIRGVFGLNIGTMITGVLILYLVFSLVMYLTSAHIDTYQVTSGPLSRNETYTGLALREESVVRSQTGGYIRYYAREGSKINANGVVYSLSSTQSPQTSVKLSSEDMARIRSDMQSFSKRFDPSRFNTAYSFKYQLEGNVLQYEGVTADVVTSLTLDPENAAEVFSDRVSDSQASVVLLGNQTLCKSGEDGIVLYSKDGYAGKRLEDLTLSDFNQNTYHETDLKSSDMIKAGDDVYTIITDEWWSLLIPLTEKQLVHLKNRETIRVKFLKDDMTQTGDFSVVQIQGTNFGKIDFNKGLIRYASDRFLDIELVTNSVNGLKIPLSSIVTKEFYVIPESFSVENGTGFYLEERGANGTTSRRLVSPTIYARISDNNTTYVPTEDTRSDSTYLYVDKSVFNKNDVLVIGDEIEDHYVIGDTGILEGVYCINQGYAVFRRIEVLDQNEEFAIVARDTDYGLVRYDHIVRDATRVKEQDILY